MADQSIRFNQPHRTSSGPEYMTRAVESGHTSSGGPFTDRATEILKEETGGSDALLTTSCTSALEMSAMLMDLQPGDSVIVPSFTFSSSALAFAREGAKILFCDIEPRTLGPDPRHVAELLDDSVRAVVAVHYAGIACDIEGLRDVLRDRPDIALIEDAAHGLFGRWRGQPLGSLGRYSTFSFHDTKNFSCGEGGALVLNRPDDVARARVLHEKGTDRRAFMEGMVDKYSWRDTGSSFALAEVLAALLTSQLEERETIQAERQRVFEGYHAALSPVAASHGLTLPVVPDDTTPAYHLFHVLLPDPTIRGEVIDRMRKQGVPTAFHYVTLHDSIAGREFAAHETDCPVSTDISRRLLRLPFHGDITDEQVATVTDTLTRVVAEVA